MKNTKQKNKKTTTNRVTVNVTEKDILHSIKRRSMIEDAAIKGTEKQLFLGDSSPIAIAMKRKLHRFATVGYVTPCGQINNDTAFYTTCNDVMREFALNSKCKSIHNSFIKGSKNLFKQLKPFSFSFESSVVSDHDKLACHTE